MLRVTKLATKYFRFWCEPSQILVIIPARVNHLKINLISSNRHTIPSIFHISRDYLRAALPRAFDYKLAVNFLWSAKKHRFEARDGDLDIFDLLKQLICGFSNWRIQRFYDAFQLCLRRFMTGTRCFSSITDDYCFIPPSVLTSAGKVANKLVFSFLLKFAKRCEAKSAKLRFFILTIFDIEILQKIKNFLVIKVDLRISWSARVIKFELVRLRK